MQLRHTTLSNAKFLELSKLCSAAICYTIDRKNNVLGANYYTVYFKAIYRRNKDIQQEFILFNYLTMKTKWMNDST